MASKQAFAVLAIIAAALPFAMATDFIVGDENGWRPGFNYTAWAEGKVFMVGDTLVFNYKEGHNVIQVGGAEFKACSASPSAEVFSRGGDVVPLETAGRKWFLCGVEDHCQRGQKLVITVTEASSQAPTSPATPPPPPVSSSSQGLSYTYQMLTVVAAAAAAAVVAMN